MKWPGRRVVHWSRQSTVAGNIGRLFAQSPLGNIAYLDVSISKLELHE